MATFTKTLRTTAPSSPTVYVRVMVRNNATPVVDRVAMTAELTVSAESGWASDVTWDTTWDNPVAYFDDGSTLWGEDEVSANMVKVEGRAFTDLQAISESAARIAGTQYGTQEIFKNDSYSVASGKVLEFDKAATTDWPGIFTVVGWTVKWYLRQQNATTPITLTVTTATATSDTHVDVTLTAAQTDTLLAGRYDYQLRAEHATHGNRTLESGVLTVKPEQV